MKNTFVILALMTSGCISATLEDNVTIKKHIDVASDLSSLISSVKTVYGNSLPADFNEKVALPATTNVDVSEQLKDFSDDKYGANYSLSNVFVKLDCGSPGCWKHVTGFEASLGNVELVKHTLTSIELTSSYISVPVVAKFDDIKKILEKGETTLNVVVDATLTNDLTISTKYDVEVSFHLTVNVEKSL